jgi:hypothetical protein
VSQVRYRSYVIMGGALFALLSIAVVLVNYIADPYDLYPYDAIRSPGKSLDLFYHLRLHKPYRMRVLAADELVIGSSRTARLPAQLQAQAKGVAYNASLPGITLRELRRTVEHANLIRPLRAVTIGLDYYMFRRELAPLNALFEDNRLLRPGPSLAQRAAAHWQSLEDGQRSLYSVDALLDSWQLARGLGNSRREFYPDGSWQANVPEGRRGRVLYGRLMRQLYAEFSSDSGELEFGELEQLLRYCEAQQIAVTLFVSPLHALSLNTIRLAGRWPDYVRWQRRLGALALQTSQVRLLGLEDNSALIYEPPGADLPAYQDGVHLTALGGRQALACLSGDCAPPWAVVELNAASIGPYLAAVETLMLDYARRHQQDYDRLLRWVDQVPGPSGAGL